MGDFNPASRSRALTAPDAARTLDHLATLLFLIVTAGILFVAREILVPVAIAILLSFVVSPVVRLLRHIGIPKALSVGIVVLSAFMIFVGVALVLAKQVSDLAADAPKYQDTVARKTANVRGLMLDNPFLKKMDAALTDVSKLGRPSEGVSRPKPPTTGPAAPQEPDRTLTPGTPTRPILVQVVEPVPGMFDLLQKVAGSAASPVESAAFVAIFVVFILMQREDLRNRFIRLVGSRDLQRTTLAMNDAARRLSRYFLAQVLLNTSFGIVIAIALSIIGVPSAILWGIVAIFMRFIPYIGAIGAAVFPILLAAAASPGWDMAIETALLFVVIEALVGQVVEPLVYGHHTGISPIAVVLSATAWTWLWGPVGLVLSTPLTVCLVVIGRHVERLAFLDIILGDAPALSLVESFYQRALAGDIPELADHAERFLKDKSLADYCDHVALPALLLAQHDVRRERLDADRLSAIKTAVDDLMEDLFDETHKKTVLNAAKGAGGPEGEHGAKTKPLAIDPDWTCETAILCVAGRTALDEAAATLLASLLRAQSLGTHVEPATSFAGDTLARFAEAGVKLIVLSFLDADLNIAQARFAVRRLRRRIPGVSIAAGFWLDADDTARTTGLCSEIRADFCIANLDQAVTLCLEKACENQVDSPAQAPEVVTKPPMDDPSSVEPPIYAAPVAAS